jgi:hypothetical protein
MQAQHKVSELSPEDRAVVERLLGRELKDDEVVQVNAQDEEVARQIEAHQALLASMRETQAKFAHVPEDELNALIDEACDYVRHHPE